MAQAEHLTAIKRGAQKQPGEATLLQRRAVSEAPARDVPPAVHQVLRAPGEPLDEGTRTFMESRFRHDFSRVRVHANARAAESARAVNALAYTVGQDVVFDRGQYQPESNRGRRLLAHELTHVVQQAHSSSPARQQAAIQMGGSHDPAEREDSTGEQSGPTGLESGGKNL